MLNQSQSLSPIPYLLDFLQRNARGILVSIIVAVAAQFLSEHYGAPAMLMALLLGIAFHFLVEDDEGSCRAGIEFTSRALLRFGVALLGCRISIEHLANLGPRMIAIVVTGVLLTILSGLLGAKLLRRGWCLGLLTGGSVAICGASCDGNAPSTAAPKITLRFA